ncbi:MAG: family 20 glycosylhydrolase, partial [Planctomycetes bacterium]|nr:family 20 glycosylhydrolase [Planctomycetota bacterium]
PKDRWQVCPKCQQRITAEQLAGENELQSWFIRRMEVFLNRNGRRIIGWDQILEGGLAPNAAVMSWRGEKGGIASAQRGHDVVMSPEKPLDKLNVSYWNDPTGGETIAWTPAETPATSTHKTWTLEQPAASGTSCSISFQWTQGTHGLDVKNMTLTHGDLTLSDAHQGFTGWQNTDNV